MKNKREKIWTAAVLLGICAILLAGAAVTVYIDPYFHYHKPLKQYAYDLNRSWERYINAGILKTYDYDSVIIGNSMTENFKASEFDALFDANTVKIPFAGGNYAEMNENLRYAYQEHGDIKNVVWCLDYMRIFQDQPTDRNDIKSTVFLRNRNPFDDVYYLLNKSMFLEATWRGVLKFTRDGNQSVDFDTYANWNDQYTFGKDEVLRTYSLDEKKHSMKKMTSNLEKKVRNNIQNNVKKTVLEHPETTFYLFFSPYSIAYWDEMDHKGLTERYLEAQKITIEELLECENVKLYSFSDKFDVICDLDNYKDQAHYGEWINSDILHWMKADEGLLTRENYKDHMETLREFFLNYDYGQLRK